MKITTATVAFSLVATTVSAATMESRRNLDQDSDDTGAGGLVDSVKVTDNPNMT